MKLGNKQEGVNRNIFKLPDGYPYFHQDGTVSRDSLISRDYYYKMVIKMRFLKDF